MPRKVSVEVETAQETSGLESYELARVPDAEDAHITRGRKDLAELIEAALSLYSQAILPNAFKKPRKVRRLEFEIARDILDRTIGKAPSRKEIRGITANLTGELLPTERIAAERIIESKGMGIRKAVGRGKQA